MAERWIFASPGKSGEEWPGEWEKWPENPFWSHFRPFFLFLGHFSPIFQVRPESICRPFPSHFGPEARNGLVRGPRECNPRHEVPRAFHQGAATGGGKLGGGGGILHLWNPSLEPNYGKRILDTRVLDPTSWVNIFDPVSSSKRGPQKNSPSRNSPSKIHLPKSRPRKSHCTSAGPFD